MADVKGLSALYSLSASHTIVDTIRKLLCFASPQETLCELLPITRLYRLYDAKHPEWDIVRFNAKYPLQIWRMALMAAGLTDWVMRCL